MNKIFLIITLFSIILLIACVPDEKTIDSVVDEWHLLIANGSGNPALTLMKLPDGDIVSNDVFFENNGENLAGSVEKIVEFKDAQDQDILFLFIPSAYLIEVVNLKTFKRQASIDFSDEKLIPSDICFPNRTDAYISHGNDSTLTLVDITNFEKARTIAVGNHPVAIACFGNQIYVANQADNTVSVIYSSTHKVEETIPVFPVPSSIRATRDGKSMLLLSVGYGKLDTTEEKSKAMVSFIDIGTRTVSGYLEIGFASFDPLLQIPKGLVISKIDWAFIPTNEALFRINSRIQSKILFVTRIEFTRVHYNPRRNELLLLKEENGSFQAITADHLTGQVKETFLLPSEVTAIYPF